MNGVPFDVVVELLMQNRFCGQVMIGQHRIFSTENEEDMKANVMAHLEALVPAPKLLSECEEYVSFETTLPIVVHRVGSGAFTGDSAGTYVGVAKDFQVIQPVEVPK